VPFPSERASPPVGLAPLGFRAQAGSSVRVAGGRGTGGHSQPVVGGFARPRDPTRWR
jgi:hypothetical protein